MKPQRAAIALTGRSRSAGSSRSRRHRSSRRRRTHSATVTRSASNSLCRYRTEMWWAAAIEAGDRPGSASRSSMWAWIRRSSGGSGSAASHASRTVASSSTIRAPSRPLPVTSVSSRWRGSPRTNADSSPATPRSPGNRTAANRSAHSIGTGSIAAGNATAMCRLPSVTHRSGRQESSGTTSPGSSRAVRPACSTVTRPETRTWML
ncbi:hypothetical protein LUW74_38905 [Actinomadura madurae]|nr:hypothetical protein [Actinomadura madurae]URN08746.1 hypothetical protein LUW74_38905 [Actinomadura madurae]